MGRTDSALHDRMIFLVGARRSGTNWLQRILTAHPEIGGLPSETYVFNMGVRPLVERFQYANPGSPMMAKMFAERDRFLDGLRDLLDGAFLDNIDRLPEPVRFMAERTPWHVYDLDLIKDVYPDARVVHIVRDGRAVARSLLAKHWGPTTMEDAAEEWRSSVVSGRRGAELFGERYREVRYEELLADMAGGVDELFAWLSLDLDAETRERVLVEAGSEFNVDPGAPGIRADKWRGLLSERDLARFNRIAGAQLTECGYETDGAPPAAEQRPLAERARTAAASARAAAARARHPRESLRRDLDRRYARRKRANLAGNFVIAERFQNHVAEGRLDDALAMLAPRVRVRTSDGATPREARGDAGRALLREALTAHEALSPRPLWSDALSGESNFTFISAYELEDGTTWSRTLVLAITADGEIATAATFAVRSVSP